MKSENASDSATGLSRRGCGRYFACAFVASAVGLIVVVVFRLLFDDRPHEIEIPPQLPASAENGYRKIATTLAKTFRYQPQMRRSEALDRMLPGYCFMDFKYYQESPPRWLPSFLHSREVRAVHKGLAVIALDHTGKVWFIDRSNAVIPFFVSTRQVIAKAEDAQRLRDVLAELLSYKKLSSDHVRVDLSHWRVGVEDHHDGSSSYFEFEVDASNRIVDGIYRHGYRPITSR